MRGWNLGSHQPRRKGLQDSRPAAAAKTRINLPPSGSSRTAARDDQEGREQRRPAGHLVLFCVEQPCPWHVETSHLHVVILESLSHTACPERQPCSFSLAVDSSGTGERAGRATVDEVVRAMYQEGHQSAGGRCQESMCQESMMKVTVPGLKQ